MGEFLSSTCNFLGEDCLFLAIATLFFFIVGWAWRQTKPYDLPHPLPGWFKIWFLTMQIGGIALPAVLLIWGIQQSSLRLVTVLTSYFLLLGLQILSESLALRQFHSVVFVMVPYLYLPYRIWRLYEGWSYVEPELSWVRYLLLVEVILWTLNYALDVTQLPRLLQWHLHNTPTPPSKAELESR